MQAYTTPKKGAAEALRNSPLRWKEVDKEARGAAGSAFSVDLRLELAGITAVSPLDELKKLVEVARDRCVELVDGKDVALPALDLLAPVGNCRGKTMCGMLKRVVDVALAGVPEVTEKWLRLPDEGVDQDVRENLISALADRALDMEVIKAVQGSGLTAEWAGAALASAYPGGSPVPQHVLAYFIHNKVWVFGDIEGVDGRWSKATRRLVQRKLHREMASKMEVTPDPSAVAALKKKYKVANVAVTSAEGFAEVVAAFVKLGEKVVVEQVGDKNGEDGDKDDEEDVDWDTGPTDDEEEANVPASGWDEGPTEDEASDDDEGVSYAGSRRKKAKTISWGEGVTGSGADSSVLNERRLYGPGAAKACFEDFKGKRGISLAPRWYGSKAFTLEFGQERTFTVVCSRVRLARDGLRNVDRLEFRLQPDARASKPEVWSAAKTLRGLADFEDAVTREQATGAATGDFSSAAARVMAMAKSGSSLKVIIKAVSKEELKDWLEAKAQEMSTKGDNSLLGFCKGGLDSGQYSKKFLEMLGEGGSAAQWLVGQRAVKRVIAACKSVISMRGKDCDPSDLKAAHLIWLTSQSKDLTPLNPTARAGGLCVDHSGDVSVVGVMGDQGQIVGREVEKDRRLQKNILSYGNTLVNIRRLTEMHEVAHGKQFSWKIYMEFGQLLDGVKIQCHGNQEVMAAIDEVTLLVWAQLPEKVFACIDHAVASGQSAGETIGHMLDLTPDGWDESVKSTIVFGAVIDNLREAGRGGGRGGGGGGNRGDRGGGGGCGGTTTRVGNRRSL